jgi:hypothetical protein
MIGKPFRAVLMIGVLGASSLGAQVLVTPASDSVVPRELFDAVLMMTGGMPGGPNQLVIGELPRSVGQRFFLPAGSRILGGVQGGAISIGAVVVPIPVDSVGAVYGREMQRLGWTKNIQTPGLPAWGFRQSPAKVAEASNFQFCSGSQMLAMSPAARGVPNSTRITFFVVRQECGPVSESRAAFTENPYRGAPVLVNPASSQSRGIGATCSPNGQSGASSSPRTALRTSMTSREILDHYNRQLADSGWTLVPASEGLVRSLWQRTDSTGARLEVVLTVSSHAGTPGCYDVEMNYHGSHR